MNFVQFVYFHLFTLYNFHFVLNFILFNSYLFYVKNGLFGKETLDISFRKKTFRESIKTLHSIVGQILK